MTDTRWAAYDEIGRILCVVGCDESDLSDNVQLVVGDIEIVHDFDMIINGVSHGSHYRDLIANEFKPRAALNPTVTQSGQTVTITTPPNVTVAVTGPVLIPPTLVEDGDITLEFIEPGDYVIYLETVAHLPHQVQIHVD